MSPCHCSVARHARARSPNTRSALAFVGQVDRKQTRPRARAPDRRRAPSDEASSCTPRQTPQNGMPARTASPIACFSSTSHGSSASSFTTSARPSRRSRRTRASPGAARPRRARRGGSLAPRSRSTSSNTPGGSQGMCWRTSVRTAPTVARPGWVSSLTTSWDRFTSNAHGLHTAVAHSLPPAAQDCLRARDRPARATDGTRARGGIDGIPEPPRAAATRRGPRGTVAVLGRFRHSARTTSKARRRLIADRRRGRPCPAAAGSYEPVVSRPARPGTDSTSTSTPVDQGGSTCRFGSG